MAGSISLHSPHGQDDGDFFPPINTVDSTIGVMVMGLLWPCIKKLMRQGFSAGVFKPQQRKNKVNVVNMMLRLYQFEMKFAATFGLLRVF